MTFQGRLVLLISGLVTLAVALVTILLAWTTHSAIQTRVEADGRGAATLLARSATLAREVPRDVEALLGDRLLSEATLAAHLVAVMEAGKAPVKAVTDRLKAVADGGGPDEIWVTDNRGRAYLHNIPGPDITFGPDARAQPRQAPYYGLLNRAPEKVVTDAATEGGKLMKFAGVAGVDKPRIVQVGADVRRLGDIARKAGVDGVMASLLAGGTVEGAWLLERDGRLAVHATGPSAGPLSERAIEAAKAAAAAGETGLLREGDRLTAFAPVPAVAGQGAGIAVVRLPAEDLSSVVGRHVKIGVLVGLLALAAGVYGAVRFARSQMAPIERLGEAVAAVEAGRFNPFTLNEAMERNDEMGRLARVFRSMALEASYREETLDAQLLMRTAELETRTEKLAAAEHLIEEEQRAARDVQANLLPQQLPAGRDSQFFGLLVPGPAVSGDFYDVIELDERQCLLVVAGVSGWGVPAAFLMLLVRGAIREAAARPGMTPAAILAAANDRLCGQSPFDGFATAFVALYDRETGALSHSSAGNRAPCRIRADGSVLTLADAGGPALGVRKGIPYGEAVARLEQEDTLFLCTEGVLRAVNAQREPFGEERLAAVLHQGRGLSARDRSELLLRAVEAHVGPGGQTGDIVCLTVRRLLPAAELAPESEATV
ncbi:HAMP domain-containing protein [Azospirillum brasilense]|uniref:HAMP domain-containing protein n=1 Tax=Azospirillum brasilense TaxID=192 RepID=A0A0P0F302_AZOBR|nr:MULTISPECIES: PP2C family protein-serine/threonine phosphatase [Azospirillum]ALJ37350.1 protein phosphatase [Azospirillum brasilense]MDW7552085.1 SpoIIE family protein phosphatase [Azospirillum brasilense]MDW7591520.1 SpoIIE family protein phosphatase [Azospirillum brasilense]MDW7626690.1 SpoIIE family protein phosphatase [Azospirillum brasilense]MDX5950961.1 SpoIIE family protein phosphatase [Azospirillum brasilense]